MYIPEEIVKKLNIAGYKVEEEDEIRDYGYIGYRFSKKGKDLNLHAEIREWEICNLQDKETVEAVLCSIIGDMMGIVFTESYEVECANAADEIYSICSQWLETHSAA